MVIIAYFVAPTTLDIIVVLGCACLNIRNCYKCEKYVFLIIARTNMLRLVPPCTGLRVFFPVILIL